MSIKRMNEFKPIFPGNEENKNEAIKHHVSPFREEKIEISKTRRTTIYVDCL